MAVLVSQDYLGQMRHYQFTSFINLVSCSWLYHMPMKCTIPFTKSVPQSSHINYCEGQFSSSSPGSLPCCHELAFMLKKTAETIGNVVSLLWACFALFWARGYTLTTNVWTQEVQVMFTWPDVVPIRRLSSLWGLTLKINTYKLLVHCFEFNKRNV